MTKGHSFYLDGVLVPIEYLVNHRSILWDDGTREVEIYHLELASHDVLLANGAPAESYRDDDNRCLFHKGNGSWRQPPPEPCAPALTGGPVVDSLWRRLLGRTGLRGYLPLTDDADVHLVVNGKRLDAIGRQEDLLALRLSAPPRTVRIRSRTVVLQKLGLARDDRSLGVAIRRIVLAQAQRQRAIETDATALSDGYHAFEQENGIRWTTGDAAVPAELFAGMSGPGMLMLHFGCTTQYLEEGTECRADSGAPHQRRAVAAPLMQAAPIHGAGARPANARPASSPQPVPSPSLWPRPPTGERSAEETAARRIPRCIAALHSQRQSARARQHEPHRPSHRAGQVCYGCIYNDQEVEVLQDRHRVIVILDLGTNVDQWRAIGTGPPLVLRRGDRGGGTSASLSARRKQGGRRGHGAECKLRFARSALNLYSVASTSSPSSSVLKSFLACGRHMFPRSSQATAESSDCPTRTSHPPATKS